MSTDFNTKTIAASGSFKPTISNTPLDIRTRIYSIDDIENIPLPYVGMIFTLVDTENNTLTNYQVKSLKSKFINTIELPNALIDEYEIFNESSQVDLSSYALKSEIPDISGKVDKVEGKGLSTEDFTTEYKNKLEGLNNTGASDEQISIAVNKYMQEHPVSGGATAEQVAQIQANKNAINNRYTKAEVDERISNISIESGNAFMCVCLSIAIINSIFISFYLSSWFCCGCTLYWMFC